MADNPKRYVAKKVRISDITNGKYFSGSRGDGKNDYNPSYVITPLGEKVSRVNIVATVIEKFVSDSGNYASLTIDDGTDAIRAKAFGTDVDMFEKIDKGSLVIVVGKVKEYQGEIYINTEIVRTVEPNYESLRRLELLDSISSRKALIDNLKKLRRHVSEEDLKEHAKRFGIDDDTLSVILEKKEVDYKPKVLNIIETLDDGEGVEITKLFDIIKLPDPEIERAIDELLADGLIYEPKPGKFKKI